MPTIHGSLTNEDFIKVSEIAKEKNMELKEWIVAVVISEIHRLKPIEAKQS
jgi:hypothetical protein